MDPLGIEFSGKLGNLVYYVTSELGVRVQKKRAYVVPVQPGSPAQLPCWTKFALAVLTWQGLTAVEKLSFRKESMRKGRQLPGYNYYISQYMLDKLP